MCALIVLGAVFFEFGHLWVLPGTILFGLGGGATGVTFFYWLLGSPLPPKKSS